MGNKIIKSQFQLLYPNTLSYKLLFRFKPTNSMMIEYTNRVVSGSHLIVFENNIISDLNINVNLNEEIIKTRLKAITSIHPGDKIDYETDRYTASTSFFLL